MITVLVANPLRSLTGGSGEIRVDATDLGGVIEAVEAQYPGFAERVVDEQGAVRPYVMLFIGDQECRVANGLDTVVATGAVVSVVAAVAGG